MMGAVERLAAALATAAHNLHWCKWSDWAHVLAHGDEPLDIGTRDRSALAILAADPTIRADLDDAPMLREALVSLARMLEMITEEGDKYASVIAAAHARLSDEPTVVHREGGS